jgi:hypothetical protein
MIRHVGEKKRVFFSRGVGAALLLGTTWVFASTLGSAKEMLGKLQKITKQNIGGFFSFFWMMGVDIKENAKGLRENARHR